MAESRPDFQLHHSPTGLDLAVFAIDPPAAPRQWPWNAPAAAKWACHPRGVPPDARCDLPVSDLPADKVRLLVAATEGADWVDPSAQAVPRGGVLCWWRTTSEGIVFGLGLHRFTVRLAAANPALPRLEVHAYLGNRLGWQPDPCPGRLLVLAEKAASWARCREFLELALGGGRAGLAVDGLAATVFHVDKADPTLGMLAPRDQVPLVPEGCWPPDLGWLAAYHQAEGPQVQAIARARAWLLRRWRLACRLHPGLRHLRAVLAATSHHAASLLEPGLLEMMGREGQACADPRRLLPGMGALSPTERRDPGRWTQRWSIDMFARGDDLLRFPCRAAARWWLALDNRSATRLLHAFPRAYGRLALGFACQAMAPRGPVRVGSRAARAIRTIPMEFWVASMMARDRQGWKSLAARSGSVQSSRSTTTRQQVDCWLKKAARLATSSPRALANLPWLVQAQVAGVPSADRRPDMEGTALADRIWEWLWDKDEAGEFSNLLATLEKVDGNWRWGTLKRHYLEIQREQDYRLAVDLAAAAQQHRQWPCALGKATWRGVAITAVCTRKGLELVGHRYANCLRQEKYADAAFTAAKTGVSRFFVLARDNRSVLLRMDRNSAAAWQVKECWGLANRAPAPEFKALAPRLARVYSRLWRRLARTHASPCAPPPPASAPLTLDLAPALGRRLHQWLMLRDGPPPVLLAHPDTGRFVPLTFEELSAPDGLLGAWIQQVQPACPRELRIDFVPSQASLCGAVVSIQGPWASLPPLVQALKAAWQDLEIRCNADLTQWYAKHRQGLIASAPGQEPPAPPAS